MIGKITRSLICATAMIWSGVGQAQEITLKISHYLPEKHGFQKDFLEVWGKELTEKTHGKVAVEIHGAGSAFGEATRQADQVKAGVVDISVGLAGIPRGRFPATSVIELPFLVKDADSGSKALWQLYKEGALGSEYDDFKVLALFVHPGGLIHTIKKPVHTLEDLAGLRLRSPNPAMNAMLESLSATPIGMPPAQIYESLERGVLDGVVTTWDLVGAMRLNELLRYHTDAKAYTSAFYVVMNKDKYASLPEDVRKAIDELSGDALVDRFGPWWNSWEAKGRADAVARGQEIIEIDDATRATWAAQVQPMIDGYLEGLKADGVTDPAALYRRAQDLVTQFKTQ